MGAKLGRLVAYCLTALCVLVILFPFLLMLSISLQTDAEIYSPKLVLLPASPQLSLIHI